MLSEDQNLRLQQDHPLVPDSGFRRMEEYVNFLIHRKAYEEAADMAQGGSVLDWGCNNGYGIEVMRSLGCRNIAGIDLNPSAIAQARQRLGDAVDLILFDGRKAPLPAERFDLVTSFQCIEHVVDHETYLSEIARVLKPGGSAIFTTPNAAIRLDPGMKPWNEFHVLEFWPADLQTLLSRYFSSVGIRGLFASAELHAVEIERCDRARCRARSPEPASANGPTGLGRLIRQLIPPAVKPYLKRQAPAAPPPRLPEHSTSEFFYQQTDLESALDLMALCRK